MKLTSMTVCYYISISIQFVYFLSWIELVILISKYFNASKAGSGRVVRWSWVNFQCRASCSLDIVGQGPIMLAVGAGGGCFDILLSSIFFLLFLSLGDGPI